MPNPEPNPEPTAGTAPATTLVLVGVATVLDTLPHVQRFVTGNLRGGLDHLVVFLDRPGAEGQAEVAAYLDAHPHVTCVRAGREWWGEHRPRGLNERQCTNANVAKAVLGESGGVAWIFHLDGDEVVRLDRAVLAGVPATVRAVRLAPREAAARLRWDGEPTLFKRPLGDDDLALLHTLGHLDQPTNQAWFHGHLLGKSGVRPGSDAWLTLHRGVDAAGRAVPAHEDERLELFHYESYSGEEFVRKWTALVRSGPRASYRPGRATTARALHALVGKDLPEGRLRAYLLEVFERTTADPVDVLAELGLLVETDPLAGTHAPRELPGPARTALEGGLERLRGAPKGDWFHGASASAERATPGRARPGVRRLLRGRS